MTPLPAGVREALERERGERVADVRPRTAGANSEVWEVAMTGGARYFVKRYPAPGPGEGDRLTTEFAALAFMARHGVRQVPGAVCALPRERVGILELVDGRPLAADEVREGEIRQATGFLSLLHGLRAAEDARELPVAKEACFSIAAHEALVRARVDRLNEGCDDAAVHAFLRGDLVPHLERVSGWIGGRAAAGGLDLAAPLAPALRTLSPSDFGFHNVLRRADGTLVFIDFEYFGWDDPAKTVADFFLQPAVPIPERFRLPLCRDLLAIYGPAADLGRRLPPVYALLALKWCLIVLNPFLRPSAGEDAAAKRARRLERARGLLARARREFEAGEFPFSGV